MPGGKLDQAMDKDLRERLHDQVAPCKPGMHWDVNVKCSEGKFCNKCVKDN